MTSESPKVIIRPLEPQDQAKAAEIWLNGLQQTTHHLIPWMPSVLSNAFFGHGMNELAATAMAPDGDVGPQGSNLCQRWSGDDRTMFVAVWNDDVVGLVGVKVGRTEHAKAVDLDPEQRQEASIWRLSVDHQIRRQGIASSLMTAAQDWAQQKGCRQITLITVNPIAHDFYTQKMNYRYEEFEHQPLQQKYPVLGRFLPKIHRYYYNLDTQA